MPPVGFIAASGGAAVGNAFSFAVPSSAKVGDSLLAVVAITDAGLTLSSTDFATLVHLTSSRGQMSILRHVVVDGEVAVLSATASGTPTKGAAVALLYRGLDANAAAGASAIASVAASVNFVCPAETLVAYSDLYLGIAFVEAATGVTPAAGTSERYDAAGAFGACQLEVFDLLAELTGTTGTKTATTGANQNGQAASILLSAQPVLAAPFITPDIPGAIGFVTVGV